MTMTMTMLLCRTGWMNYYQGLSDNDQVINGGDYVDQNETGHEIFNDMIMPVSQAIARQDPMHLSAQKIEDSIA